MAQLERPLTDQVLEDLAASLPGVGPPDAQDVGQGEPEKDEYA